MRRTLVSLSVFGSLTCYVLLGLSGCDSGAKPSTSPNSSSGANADASTKKTQCDGILTSMLGKFERPQVISNFDAEQAESLLNQWRRSCLSNGEKASAEQLEKWGTLLPADQVTLLQADVYSKRDAEHLQTSIWMHVLEQVVNGAQNSDLGRVRSAFDYVVRTVALIPNHPEETPLSLKGVIIAGEGTVEDRVLLFSELLRQLKIDVVLISPPATTAEQEQGGPLPRSLVGALLDNEVHLFDPLIGVAVPATAAPLKSLADEKAATWTQVAANPQLLRRMDLPGLPLDLNEKNLATCRIRLIGQTSLWAPRLADLRDHFSGSFGTYVYDDLVDQGGRKGLLTRVLENGKGWKREQISVWGYPERQLIDRDNLSSLQKQFVEKMRQMYRLPLTRNIESKSQNESFNDPTGANAKAQLKNNPAQAQWAFEESQAYFQARGQQIMGRFEDAVKTQMLNQRSCRFFLEDFPGPRAPNRGDDERTRAALEQFRQQYDRLKMLHAEILENAVFWLGMIKLEQGTAESRRIAAEKYEQYLREYPEGVWGGPCRMILAMENARNGKQAEAIARLKEIPANSSYKPVAQWWLREWEPAKVEEKKPAAPEKAKEEKPKEEKPASKPEDKTAEQKKLEEKKPAEAPKVEVNKPAPAKESEKKPEEKKP